jgi:hypothetical protein
MRSVARAARKKARLPFSQSDASQCRQGQRMKHVIDIAWRQSTAALDPPVQDKNEG